MDDLLAGFQRITSVVEAPEQLGACAVDGLVPKMVLQPATEGEAAACLGLAARHGLALAPRGGGTGASLGNIPRRLDAVLSLGRLNQVLEYVPEDLTVTVQAGMRLSDLQELVAQHGQTVPLDPPRGHLATLGGIIAAGSSGSRRAAYGGPRDLLLGARVALAGGRVIKTGGRVVKNVAGYDMNKLLVGSLGTLGVITELTLKLRPLPACSRTLRIGFASPGAALSAAEAILNSELLPTALSVLSPGAARRLEAPGPACLAVELAESELNVAYQAERIAALTAGAKRDELTGTAETAFWEAVRNYGDLSRAPLQARVATVPGELAALMETQAMDAIAHVAAGTLLLYGAPEAAGALPPTAVVEAAPPELKRGRDVWGPPRPEWRLMQEIKRALDPAGILNPGRFVGGI